MKAKPYMYAGIEFTVTDITKLSHHLTVSRLSRLSRNPVATPTAVLTFSTNVFMI